MAREDKDVGFCADGFAKGDALLRHGNKECRNTSGDQFGANLGRVQTIGIGLDHGGGFYTFPRTRIQCLPIGGNRVQINC